jgi:hypothetical protein
MLRQEDCISANAIATFKTANMRAGSMGNTPMLHDTSVAPIASERPARNLPREPGAFIGVAIVALGGAAAVA